VGSTQEQKTAPLEAIMGSETAMKHVIPKFGPQQSAANMEENKPSPILPPTTSNWKLLALVKKRNDNADNSGGQWTDPNY